MLRSENLYEILDKYFSQIQKNSYYKREVQKFLMKKYEYSDIEYMQDKVLQYVKAKGRIMEYVVVL